MTFILFSKWITGIRFLLISHFTFYATIKEHIEDFNLLLFEFQGKRVLSYNAGGVSSWND